MRKETRGLETFEMFHIGQRIICVDDRFVGENHVFDRTFTVRCPNLPVKSHVYTRPRLCCALCRVSRYAGNIA